MPSCTCTSPDGTQSTTYEFDSAPYGGEMGCDMACRYWAWNHAYSQAYPYGSAKREAKMGSCKMWVKECGSGPDWISLSEPRTECVAGDKVGAKLVVNHGHGMGQEVDISLNVLKASDEIVDVVEMEYGPDIDRYKGVEGPLKTITNPDSPFYGQQVRTCLVNGFDSYVYQVTRHPSSDVEPIATTAWGDVDVSTGDDVGQLAVPLFKFRKHLGRQLDPLAGANYGLNPFYDPDAICSIEEYFEISGLTWETIEGNSCENKVQGIIINELGSGTNLYSSTADYEFACRMQMGELLPKKDFNEMYSESFSEQKMWQEYDELSIECIEEGIPYDLDVYCALYHWNTANDGGICTGYDVENNPLGSAWWSGTSNSYGGTINPFHPYYLSWLKGYLVEDLGLTQLADADPMDLGEYHNNSTWNNFLISDEAAEYSNNNKKITACVMTKLYDEYPNQFDWRGAFPPSNLETGQVLLPEEMVGTYDWFDENDVDYDGQVVVQTNSPTSNEYGYEAIEIPEGVVKLDYYEVPLEGQDVVAEFRGEVEVSDDINESREILTDDTREPEGIFLPDDPELEVVGAEEDFISSVEDGQIEDEDLNKIFSEESAVEVANMFENIAEEEEEAGSEIEEEVQDEEDEIIEEEADEVNEAEDDVVVVEEEEVTPQNGGALDAELFNPQMAQETIVVHRPLEPQTQDAIPTKSAEEPTPFYKNPAFIAVGGALAIGAITFLIISKTSK
jgi:hypothetical protein